MHALVAIIFTLYAVRIAIIVGGIVGWGINLVKFFNMPWDAVTGELVIRLAGIPIPIIGAVAGWF